LPQAKTAGEFDEDLKSVALGAAEKVEAYMNKFSFSQALEEIWIVVRRTNKYIDETIPWVLAKDEASKDRLYTVLHNLAEAIRVISILIYPFMHTTSKEIRKQLGIWYADVAWKDAFTFDLMGGEKVKKGAAIFPRLDIEKELEELEALKEELSEPEIPPTVFKPEITMEDFEKIDLKSGKILECKKHPKADKLLVSKVKIGTDTRQIVSGVAKFYSPDEMVGKTVIVVANLKPINLRGEESKGMILFADNGEKLAFVTTDAADGNSVT
jgi:methionyl-tRNA synthetase